MWRQVRKEPKEVAAERKEEARSANAAARREQQDKNDAKKRMKGKNKPSRRQRKKQLNVIEERKGKQFLDLSCFAIGFALPSQDRTQRCCCTD